MRLARHIVLACAFMLPASARAYNFSSLFFFGDSLTDEGRAGRTAPVMWPTEFRNDTSITTGVNYAIGGAFTSNQPDPVFGDRSYIGQINSFVATNTIPTANSAAGIWIGTNNIWIGSAQHISPSTLASTASQDVKTGITTLVGAGVHNVLLLGIYDQSLTNAFIQAGANTIAVRDAAAAASAQYNARLAALTVPGATIQYFNIANFINHLQSNPQAYGFQQILPLQPGVSCNASCQQTSIFTDVIHFTAKTQALIGDYVASGNPIYNATNFTYGAIADNLASAAAAASIQGRLSSETAGAFAGSLLDRLDATRDLAFAVVVAGDPSEGRSVFAPVAPPNPWSIFAYGSVVGGNFGRIGNPTTAQSDLDAVQGGFTGGAEYRAIPGLRVGAAFNYAHDNSNLSDTLGITTRIDGYQGALYASYATPRLFFDGVVSGGGADLTQSRTGTFGLVTSSPRAGLFSASTRGGYLLQAGPIRIGPMGGFSYTRASIDGYSESGAALYAIGATRQNFDSLYGSGGIEIRLAGPYAAAFSPFVTATYNQQILRATTAGSNYLAALPTQTLPGYQNAVAGNFVKVALGSSFAIGPLWYGTVTAFGLAGDETVGGLNLGLTRRF